MSDKPPNEGDRNSNLALFAADEKARQQLSQAASSLFNPVPQMFPGALSPLTLHPSFAAVSQLAFQQIVNSATQPRPSLFAGGPFFDVKSTAHSFPGLPPFPTITPSSATATSVFSPPPIIKASSAVVNPPPQRAHIGPSASPGLPGRQAIPAHSSTTPTVIVKQQQAIIGSTSAMGASSQQPVKVSSGSGLPGNGGSGHRSHSHHHSSDGKRLQPGDMPPVVIASPASGVRLVASSPFQSMQQSSAPGLSGYPSSTPPGGQPRLVPIQQQQQGDVPKIASTAGPSMTRPSVVQSSSSSSMMRHSSSQHQSSGASPGVIPVVKISSAATDQTIPVSGATKVSRADGRIGDSQQFHPSAGGIFYATQPQLTASNVASLKTFPAQSGSNRVPWSPLVHQAFPHSRPVVPVGGNGQAVMADTDLSGGHGGVSSRPGILRKRPAGDGGGVGSSQIGIAAQSPRRSIPRLPSALSGVVSSSSAVTPQMLVPIYTSSQSIVGQNLSLSTAHTSGNASTPVGADQFSSGHGFVPPALSRDASASSITSQPGVKAEAADSSSEQPTRKRLRKQQLLPRTGPDNLMVTFDPLSTIPQLPTVPTSSHHRQHKHGVSGQNAANNSASASTHSAASAATTAVKEEAEVSPTPEPEVTEDDRKMTQLMTGELAEFTDSEGVRWFSLRNGEASKSNKHASKCQQSPAPKLSDFYKCTWRTRYNHFERHSDVRAKDERCPALSEFCVAARSHVAREAAGWRVVQFLTLLDDQMAVEHKTLNRVADMVESCHSVVDGSLSKHFSLSNNANSVVSECHQSTSIPSNGAPAKRGRGGAHRLSAGGAARQSARTRQQHQQQVSNPQFPFVNVPFEYTQLPDMFSELNRRLKAVSSNIQSLYSAHVPVAHQLLDKYAPLKTLKTRSRSSASLSSSTSSNPSTEASSAHLGGESVPISPTLSNKDLKESPSKPDQATEECLIAAVQSVSEQFVEEDKQRLLTMETTSISPAKEESKEEPSIPDVLTAMESSTCVS